MSQASHTEEHRDDIGSRFGMWLFIFTEMLLFAGLFIVYAVYRYKNWQAFHLAAEELDTTIGAINTVGEEHLTSTLPGSLQEDAHRIDASRKILSVARGINHRQHFARIVGSVPFTPTPPDAVHLATFVIKENNVGLEQLVDVCIAKSRL